MASSTMSKDGRTLIWTNSNPGSFKQSFTINVDLSEYSSIEVVYRPYTGYANLLSSGQIPIGVYGSLQSIMGTSGYNSGALTVGLRTFNSTTTGITFENGNMAYDGTTWSTNNSECIPVYVYAYK